MPNFKAKKSSLGFKTRANFRHCDLCSCNLHSKT
jgi:hypothetical protein